MKEYSFLKMFYRTLGSSLAGLVLTIIYSVLSARMLGAEGRGILAAIQLWPTVLAGTMTLGLSASFVYHARQQRHMTGNLFATGLLVTVLVAGVSGALGMTLLSHLLPSLSIDQIEFTRVYLVIMLPATAITIYIGGCTQILDGLSLFNAGKIVPVLLQVIAIVTLYITVGLTPERLAIATIATTFITVAWMMKSSIKVLGFSLRSIWIDLGLLISYGMSVWAVEIFGVLTQQIDKIWVSGVLSLADLGHYTLAFGMSRVIANIQNSAAAVLFPRNIGKPMAEVVQSTAQAFRLTFWPTLFISVPVSLLAIPVFPLIFGQEFFLSGQVFPILVLECILGTSSWVLAQAFNSLGKPHLIVIRQAAGLVGTIAFAFLLVPKLGIWGVALAVLVGAAVRLAVTIFAFKKGLGIGLPRLLFCKADIVLVANLVRKRLGA